MAFTQRMASLSQRQSSGREEENTPTIWHLFPRADGRDSVDTEAGSLLLSTRILVLNRLKGEPAALLISETPCRVSPLERIRRECQKGAVSSTFPA